MASVTLSAYQVTIRKKGLKDLEVISDYDNGKDITNFVIVYHKKRVRKISTFVKILN